MVSFDLPWFKSDLADAAIDAAPEAYIISGPHPTALSESSSTESKKVREIGDKLAKFRFYVVLGAAQ